MPPKAIIKRLLEKTPEQKYLDRFKQTKIIAAVELTADDLIKQAEAEANEDDEESAEWLSAAHIAKRSKTQTKARSISCNEAQKLEALSGKMDYKFESIFQSGKNQFVVTGGAQSNNRKSMLERTDHGTLQQIHHLSHHDLYQWAANTFDRLQDLADTKETRHIGACVTNVVVDPVNQRLITITLGNLPAWLFWIDEKGYANIRELNDCLHVAGNERNNSV